MATHKKNKAIKTPLPGVPKKRLDPPPKPRPPAPSGPDIVIGHAPVGRETLVAIESELHAGPRDALPTLPYGDSVPNAPGAVTPSRIATERAKKHVTAAMGPEICELLSFVVRGMVPADSATDGQRRRFIEAKLLDRLPTPSMASVDRIDVAPFAEKGSLLIRVFCKLSVKAGKPH